MTDEDYDKTIDLFLSINIGSTLSDNSKLLFSVPHVFFLVWVHLFSHCILNPFARTLEYTVVIKFTRMLMLLLHSKVEQLPQQG